jgi:hypothetical protein
MTCNLRTKERLATAVLMEIDNEAITLMSLISI